MRTPFVFTLLLPKLRVTKWWPDPSPSHWDAESRAGSAHAETHFSVAETGAQMSEGTFGGHLTQSQLKWDHLDQAGQDLIQMAFEYLQGTPANGTLYAQPRAALPCQVFQNSPSSICWAFWSCPVSHSRKQVQKAKASEKLHSSNLKPQDFLD